MNSKDGLAGHNQDILNEIGALTKEKRTLDLGQFSPQYAGKVLECWVNAPAILEEIFVKINKDVETGNVKDYTTYRRIVDTLFELAPGTANRLPDDLMLWLFAEGSRLYREYQDFLRPSLTSSPGGGTPTSTPSTNPA